MRWTQTLIPTLREIPKDAEADSHKLLLRAGYVRKLSSGVYSYLPLGYRVLRKITAIIEEEMARADCVAILMPALHPAELWKKTGRYEALGEDKLAFKNRTGQEFVLGPTHEEVVTELVGAYVKSHRDLPKSLYQIQTKFRDELRPRFGIIRTKEFIMKDAYSFDRDEAGLDVNFQKMYAAYERIFTRCGLTFYVVGADSGLMGGKVSQEFMVKCPFGEDIMVECSSNSYTVSREIARRAKTEDAPKQGQLALEKIHTPNLRTIEELCAKLKIKADKMAKSILYIIDEQPVMTMVRGDREVNEPKLREACQAKSLRLADKDEIRVITGAPVGFSGPVGLKNVRVIADYDLTLMEDFLTGANEADYHYKNVNRERDFIPDMVADIRYVEEGDRSHINGELLKLSRTMEVGHVFKLGTRYTQALNCQYLDEAGNQNLVIMGCYGIGVNRILAAHVEEHHDEKGMIWSPALAPFTALVICLNQKDGPAAAAAELIYRSLTDAGIETLYDDRDERAGVKFNDGDLTGIPIQIIVSERNLAENQLEVVIRNGKKSQKIHKDQLLACISSILNPKKLSS